MGKKKEFHPEGEVVMQLGGGRYTVAMKGTGQEVIAYLAGKMKTRNISVHVGDTVEVVLDPAGGHATNRIVWRK